VKVLFRKGDPAGQGKPARLASVRNNGGWFGGAGQAPAVPMDHDVISDEEFHKYVTALKRNGFFGPDSWYMNDAPNAAYGRMSAHGDQLAMPVLFFHAAYDYTCETLTSRLAEPMRRHCDRLTEITVHSGHWMAQEKPVQVNAGLAKWLAVELQEFWAG
jgi:pimeloyl-ACP methyl ester carboxylesterase